MVLVVLGRIAVEAAPDDQHHRLLLLNLGLLLLLLVRLRARSSTVESLVLVSLEVKEDVQFFPSDFVTSGWSFGVVKVYTRPVSETTRSKTCVPVRTDSSYACVLAPVERVKCA